MVFLIQVLSIAAIVMMAVAGVRYFFGAQKGDKTALDIRISIAGVLIFIAVFISVMVTP